MKARITVSTVVTLLIATCVIIAQGGAASAERAREITPKPLAATASAKWVMPRTPWGDPDCQGYWTRGPRNSFNVEGTQADGFAGAVKGWIVDPPGGKIPYHPWAAKKGRQGEFYNNYLDPHLHGVLPGPPRGLWLEHGATQIIQKPDQILFKMEVQHFYRIIYMDGRRHPPERITFDMGHSVGHWEGNTLVVDVSNLSARNWMDLAGNFYSDAAHIVERYTLSDANTIAWEVTVEDPYVYTRPWKMAASWSRQQEPYEQIEEAFREGERDHALIREALPTGAIERETLARYPPMTKREAQRQLELQRQEQAAQSLRHADVP